MSNFDQELFTSIVQIRERIRSVLDEKIQILSDENFEKKLVREQRDELLAIATCSLLHCKRCRLHEQRTHTVYGEGNSCAEVMFIGEGPGQTEDETGRPFVGKAGQLLDKIIEAMGLRRADVYIANIVKCRPPGNRNPEIDEVSTCRPFLNEQIAIVAPKIIVALGSPAIKMLLNTTDGISKLRGHFYAYRGIHVMPTYHPSYLLRDPSHKKETWEDMQKVMHFLKDGVFPKSS